MRSNHGRTWNIVLLTVVALLGTATVLSAGPPTTRLFEIGDDDFRISAMGMDGSTLYSATDVSVAYASLVDEFLVVWSGDTDEAGLVDNEFEVWGQRFDGSTGLPLGGRIRISDMGPDGDDSYRVFAADVVYNPTANEFLVVWGGTDDSTTNAGEEEIWGQRLQAGTGSELGANDFRISNQGDDGDPGKDARGPAVAYNAIDDEYLVVWAGDSNAPFANDKFEIFGQRLDGVDVTFIGTPGFRISETGAIDDQSTDATEADVVHNPIDNEYLVVWQANTDEPPLVAGELEIWGQVIDGATGADVGDDRRLSDMGPDGDALFAANSPAVAHDPVSNRYVVVWSGDDDSIGNSDFEIFAQLVAGDTLTEIGNDVRISQFGPDGGNGFPAVNPAVAFAPTDQEMLIVWRAEDTTPPYVNNDMEIFGQRFDPATGTAIGDYFPVSALGPLGDPDFDADRPAIAAAPNRQSFVAFQGDSDEGMLVDDELEIFGQRLLLRDDWVDLQVTVTDGVTSADPGGVLTYTLEVSNLESGFQTMAEVNDLFPTELSCAWTSVATPGVTGNGSGTGDLNNLLMMPSGSSATYTIDCDIDPFATGTLVNTATVLSDLFDFEPVNNTASDDDTVLREAADLAITMSADLDLAVPGQGIVYTVTLDHNGTADATGATVQSIAPAELEVCSWTCVPSVGATCNPAAGSDLQDTVDLVVGASVVYTGDCTVISDLADTPVVSASSVAAPVSPLDPIQDNNMSTVEVPSVFAFVDGFESGDTSGWSSTVQD